MKVLLLGKNGQVGWELQRTLLPMGEIVAPGRDKADFSDPDGLRSIIRSVRPDVIVNAAAYTSVDRAESEEEIAFRINAEAVGVLAEEAHAVNSLLLHISTDYVFDGSKENPYNENDLPRPLSVYGRSKLQAEEYIRASGCDFIILRTSWIYSSRGNNFLLTMIKLMTERNNLRIVDDQIGSPTWSRHIAESVACVIWQSGLERDNSQFDSGIYHLTARGSASWYEFAREISTMVADTRQGQRLAIRDIEPITSAEYPLPAKRPLNSLLNCEKLEKKYRLAMPDWKRCLELALQEMC